MPITKGIEAWAIMVHDTDTPLAAFHKSRKMIVEAARLSTFAVSGDMASKDRTKIRDLL